MKKSFIFWSLVILFAIPFNSCADENQSFFLGLPDEELLHTIHISISTKDQISIDIRMVNEDAIENIHFFMFGPENRHYLIEDLNQNLIVSNLKSGKYRIYAFGNCNRVHEKMSEYELKELLLLYSENQSNIAMTCQDELIVGGSNNSNKQIVLERATAKISFSIHVRPGVNVNIVSVKLCNLPDRGKAFSNGTSEAINIPGVVYYNLPEEVFPETKQYEYGPIYMYENHRGLVRTIIDSTERNPEIAPGNATYLYIRAKQNLGYADYWVYWGNDNLQDFNVSRNKHYTYNITIFGTNPNDARVTSYTLRYMNTALPGGYGEADVPLGHYFMIKDTPDAYTYHIQAECLQGEWQYMSMRGKSFVNGKCDLGSFESNSGGINVFTQLKYNPPIFTNENEIVEMRYTVTDQYGYKSVFENRVQFANVVRAYWKWNYIDSGASNSWAGDRIGSYIHWEDKDYYQASFLKAGQTVRVYYTTSPNKYIADYYSDENLINFYYPNSSFITYTANKAKQYIYPKCIDKFP